MNPLRFETELLQMCWVAFLYILVALMFSIEPGQPTFLHPPYLFKSIPAGLAPFFCHRSLIDLIPLFQFVMDRIHPYKIGRATREDQTRL